MFNSLIIISAIELNLKKNVINANPNKTIIIGNGQKTLLTRSIVEFVLLLNSS
jgi:hypothetical protein